MQAQSSQAPEAALALRVLVEEPVEPAPLASKQLIEQKLNTLLTQNGRHSIRCRLKTIEESFRGSSLVRCHRKYIVNMDKVQSLRREKDGYELDLEDQSIPSIPITKTYAENVLSRFNSRK